ncbi:MAG: hypothetical protein R8G01_09640 [Ilumatobacteraceae bacterium]|nr:hypothetical protein [Ilumatobacteraceae bacterium]
MSSGDLELRVAWERHVGTGEVSGGWYESVIARHHEAHRHYHDVRHVRWVVRHVGELAAARDGDQVADLGAVVVAAFFHDVVYDPTASDNEVASATLAARALAELDWPTARVARVVAMIEGTAHHRVDTVDGEPITLDTAVLYAADLGVLAADPAGYADYVRNVRREYGHVDDADWSAGRTAVLRSFLERRAIYAPELGLDAWERRARANLAAELDTLGR